MKSKFTNIITILIVNYIILLILSIILSVITKFSVKDSLFLLAILSIIISFFINSSGNPLGLSIRSMGQNSAQYSSRMDLESKKSEIENLKLNFNLAQLFKSTLFLSSVLIIITSFIIK